MIKMRPNPESLLYLKLEVFFTNCKYFAIFKSVLLYLQYYTYLDLTQL